MPEILYTALQNHLSEKAGGGFSPVYLIHGEEALVETAKTTLTRALLPRENHGTHLEVLDGAPENVENVIERVNTYSLLPGDKVVIWRDAHLFHSRADHGRLLEKAVAAHRAEDSRKAAKTLATLLGFLSLSPEEATPEIVRTAAGAESADEAVIDRILVDCREQDIRPQKGGDPAGVLLSAIQNGFPAGHYLIVTTDIVDRRKALFKTIHSVGGVIDCQVPKGERKVDRAAREALLRDIAARVLSNTGKTLAPDAFSALVSSTGFDARMFQRNLETLVDYVGEARRITAGDVSSAVTRTRRDPVFDFTNAVCDKNPEAALFYMRALIDDGTHPLQLLAALINRVRRLILFRDFMESHNGKAWRSGMDYRRFQDGNIVAGIAAYDEALSAAAFDLPAWGPSSPVNQAESGKKTAGKTDLHLGKTLKSPYPLFMTLLQADRFSKKTLASAYQTLHAADLTLKSADLEPARVLERAILSICRPPTDTPGDPEQAGRRA